MKRFLSFNFFFLGLHHDACGILVPWPGSELRPWQWKRQVSTSGPPANSLSFLIWLIQKDLICVYTKSLGSSVIFKSEMRSWDGKVWEALLCMPCPLPLSAPASSTAFLFHFYISLQNSFLHQGLCTCYPLPGVPPWSSNNWVLQLPFSCFGCTRLHVDLSS